MAKHQVIGVGGFISIAGTALTSLMGNQREFLSILALNRIRAFYEASKNDQGTLVGLHINEFPLKVFMWGFAAVLIGSWFFRLKVLI